MCRNHGGEAEEEHPGKGARCLQTQAIDRLSRLPLGSRTYFLLVLIMSVSLWVSSCSSLHCRNVSVFFSNLTQPQSINCHLYTGTWEESHYLYTCWSILYLYISALVRRMETFNQLIEFVMPMNNFRFSSLCPAYSIAFSPLFLGE